MSDDLVIEVCHALADRSMRTDHEGERSIYREQEAAVRALLKRRDELLVTIRNLSASTPYPEEAGSAAVLIAET